MEESTEAPSQYASVASLLQPVEQAETTDVWLSSGTRVAVRGLTRRELLDAGKGTDDHSVIEARNVAFCLVRPTMTYAQVREWQSSCGTVQDFAAVTEAIRDASGLREGADKSDVDPTGD